MASPKGGSRPASSSEVAPQHLHLWQIQAVRDIAVILLLVLIVWAGYAMRAVTVPLLVALLLAYLFEPLVAKLSSRQGMSRPMVVSGLLLTFGAVLTAALAIIIPLLVTQTMQLVDDVRDGRFVRSILTAREYVPEDYQDEFDRLARFFIPADLMPEDMASDASPQNGQMAQQAESPDEHELGPEENTPEGDAQAPPADGEEFAASPQADELPPAVAAELDALRRDVDELRHQLNTNSDESQQQPTGDKASVITIVRQGVNVVFQVVGEIIAIGLLAFLIPFYFFFFSVWYPSVVRFGRDLIPPNRRERVFELLGKMDRAVAGFVRGRIVIAVIMGALLAIGWQIVGVQYAIVLGFIIGFFSIVPYLGGVGIPLAIGLMWLGQVGQPADDRMAWYFILLWPTLVWCIVQFIETYFLTPMIAGKATNLDPVSILVAVLAGGTIMGVYGMLLAIPLAACIKIIFTEVLLPRIKMWSRGMVEDPLPIERD